MKFEELNQSAIMVILLLIAPDFVVQDLEKFM